MQPWCPSPVLLALTTRNCLLPLALTALVGLVRNYVSSQSKEQSADKTLGRNVLRAALARSDIKIVAINHTCSTAEDLLYLLRNDSSMGVLDSRIDVQRLSESMICIDGQKISLISQRDVKKINWSALGAEYILECTGKFTKKDLAMDHIVHGHAKRVIISAPSPDSPTFVYGVNSESYLPSDDYRVVSNASCTTNCITPVLKVLHDNFGIAQAFLTTVHAATRSQQVLDGYNNKNRRLGKPAATVTRHCFLHLTSRCRPRCFQQHHTHHNWRGQGSCGRTPGAAGKGNRHFTPGSNVSTCTTRARLAYVSNSSTL